MFKAFYDSLWHAPLAFWLGQVIFLAVLVRRRGPPFFVVFTIIAALDAWSNGALTPLGSPALKTGAAVVFVLLGDFRFFYLVERKLSRAVALTFVVPLVVLPVHFLGVSEQYLWMAYEGGLFLLASVLWPMRKTPAARALIAFELGQYGLWLVADLVLLGGADVGWGIRVVPNLMYYTLFLPFAWRRTT